MSRTPSSGPRQAGRAPWAPSIVWGRSLVSLTALIWATQAHAETDISTARTSPIATATANNGAPDDVVVTAGGSITLSSGTAITLNSNNSVTNGGSLKIQDANGAIGILGLGGHTGAITNNGSIVVNESTTPPSPPGGGDGPFATGSNRFGIRITGPGAFTGNITQGSGSSITVQGVNSAGISVETDLVGSIVNGGTVQVTGDNSFGLRTTGNVSGSVTLTAGVSAAGANSEAVVLGGDVGGKFEVENTITATGFRSTTHVTDAASLAAMNANDKLIGGPAIDIQGNVAGGVSLDDTSGPAGTAALVNSFGSAPALRIGAVGRDVTLGDFGSGADARGLLIKGTVTANGVQDGVATTAVQLGLAGGGAVNTTDGIRLSGTVSSLSFQANATGFLFNAGAKVPFFEHDGTTAVGATADNASVATGFLIQPGATVSGLANTGTVSASLTGPVGNATTIQDRSGTLSFIHNLGTISAAVLPAANSGVTAGGVATALDLSANTGGVTVLQEKSTATGAAAPTISGAIVLGSGSDNLQFMAGSEFGDISFGAGANSLTIANGATVAGAMTATGGTLAVNVASGSLTINNAAHLNLTSLNLGSASQTILTADPVAGGATELDVHGTAVIATGAKIGLRFNSLVQGSQTFTLIRADQLQAGTIDQSLLGLFPFVYQASLATNPAAGTVTATIVQKTASQIGLPAATQAGFAPMLVAANASPDLRNAILAQTDRNGLVTAFNQLLPNHSGGVFETYAATSDAVARAIDDRQGEGGGLWLQEVNFGLTANGQTDVPGYSGYGVGLVGGYELPGTPLGVVGLTAGGTALEMKDRSTPTATGRFTVDVFEAGAYWRYGAGGFSTSLKVAGDYVHNRDERDVSIASGSTVAFAGQAVGRWSGAGFNARFRAGYETWFGGFYARPQVGLDYVHLQEDGYTETGGGPLDLTVDSRTSSRMSGFVGTSVGKLYGANNSWGPEVLVGYHAAFTNNVGSTTAHFLSGGGAFTLSPDDTGGSGAVARIGVKGENGYGGFAVEGGAEVRSNITVFDLTLTAHMRF